MSQSVRRTLVILLLAVPIAAGAAVYWWTSRTAGLPQPGSAEYEQATRYFHRGLAGLQVGLLDGAIEDFTRATTIAAGEPAIWANLGLTHLRLGAFDAAMPAVARAAELAKHAARPVIAYCARGQRSRMAASSLAKAGFSEIYHLNGGIDAWRAAGLPLERG